MFYKVLLLLGLLFSASLCYAEESAFKVVAVFQTMDVLSDTSGLKIVYGDDRGYLHLLKQSKSGFSPDWRSDNLGASLREVLVEDLNADQKPELISYTSAGKIFVFDTSSYVILWESGNEYQKISSMEVANVDKDRQKELVFCADSHIYVRDGKTFFEQTESREEFEAQDIAVGDVDGDGRKEIILNTGYVLDSMFCDLEWRYSDLFGDKIELLNIDEDMLPEVIGEFQGGFLKIFDLDIRREKW